VKRMEVNHYQSPGTVVKFECHSDMNWKESEYRFQKNGTTFLPSGLVVEKKATWLILPVVIRSSQRLSHACLSINNLL
jgi:hypothetical protein